mmetsp:Transcript_5880/g.12809  ORF Transcript_5880/g.12809 Transcript_5880/m.12809 type:complete len:207 (+) Transcript_5880:267-887(+)
MSLPVHNGSRRRRRRRLFCPGSSVVPERAMLLPVLSGRSRRRRPSLCARRPLLLVPGRRGRPEVAFGGRAAGGRQCDGRRRGLSRHRLSESRTRTRPTIEVFCARPSPELSMLFSFCGIFGVCVATFVVSSASWDSGSLRRSPPHARTRVRAPLLARGRSVCGHVASFLAPWSSSSVSYHFFLRGCTPRSLWSASSSQCCASCAGS